MPIFSPQRRTSIRCTRTPPAPKQVPQIEVTFDIDANGIVNVYAKDKGTNKEQHITITASTNMSKEEVEAAVAEAEKYAAEDTKRKEAVEIRNNADQVIYQCEKSMNDMGDKLSADEKAPVQAQIDKLKETLKGDNTDAIKADTEALQQAFYKIAEKIYAQTQQNPGDPNAAGVDPTADNGGADYTVVDDDNN